MFNREKQEMKRVPMMPVRDMVIFPQQMTPFIVGREASVRDKPEFGDRRLVALGKKDSEPVFEDEVKGAPPRRSQARRPGELSRIENPFL